MAFLSGPITSFHSVFVEGQLSLGTSTPGTKLDIVDDGTGVRVQRLGIDFRIFNSTASQTFIGSQTTTDVLFQSNATTRLTLDSSGTLSLNQNRLVSMRTTASLDSTSLAVNEFAIANPAVSGATLAIRINGVIYLFNSSGTTVG